MLNAQHKLKLIFSVKPNNGKSLKNILFSACQMQNYLNLSNNLHWHLEDSVSDPTWDLGSECKLRLWI